MIDDLPEDQCCRDIAIMQQIQIMRPGSKKIPVVLQNLLCRVLKIRKGITIAHVEASNVVPPLTVPQMDENMPEKVVGNPLKGDLLKNLPRGNDSRVEKCFESLNLEAIESWKEQQQQSARDLIQQQ